MRLISLFLLAITCLAQSFPMRINVGGPTYTDQNGNTWQADTGCTSTSTYSRATAIRGTASPTLYQTGRTATSTLNCTYTVPSPAFYIITLKFAETDPTVTATGGGSGAKPRIMNGYVNNILYFQQLNVLAVAPFATAYDVATPYVPVSIGQISITLSQVAFQPMLSGIEIDAVSAINVPSGGPTISTTYNFPAQSPGGTLTASTPATATLAPCPLGVSGSDIQHYLYIPNATAEAVLITGGSCTPGAASGTVTFTPAHNHSGGWLIESANAGTQEAVNSAGSGANVFIPNDYASYGPVFINTKMTICGAGPQTPVITDMDLTATVFNVVTGASGSTGVPVVFCNLSIQSISVQTAGFFISISAIAGQFNIGSQIRNCTFKNGFQDVNLINVASLIMDSNNYYAGAPNEYHVVMANPVNGDGGDNHITNNWFVGSTSTTAILYNSGGGLEILGNKFNGVGTGLNATWNASSGQVYIVSNSFDGLTTNGILFSTTGGALLTDWIVGHNFFDGCPTNGYLEVFPNGGTITRGVISGNDFDGGCTTLTAIDLQGGFGYTINGNQAASGAGATVIHAVAGVTGAVVGNEFQAAFNAGYNVSASSLLFGFNGGITDVIGTVNAAASLVIPLNPTTTVNGSGVTITSVTPPTQTVGLTGTFLMAGVNTFTAGATIANTCTTVAGKPYQWVWDGAHLFISGSGC